MLGFPLVITHVETLSVKERHMQHFGDNFIPVIADTQPLHTREHPFCGDPTCLCFEDEQNKEQLAQAMKDGLITPDDANRIMKGETI